MKSLDLSTFPLDGLALMEASAGTGKTYALSNLYLRYILEKNYGLDQILVVTFTEAATQELRVRVRANIVECIATLEQVIAHTLEQRPSEQAAIAEPGHYEVLSGADVPDEVYSAWVQQPLLKDVFLRLPNLLQSLMTLKLAEQSIDLSEIHTIHGFCQKVAKENAVLLNVPASQVLKEDLTPLRLEVCEDLWRSEILKLDREAIVFVESNWKTPDDLLASLKLFGSRQPQVVTPRFDLSKAELEQSPIEYWAQCFSEFNVWVADLKGLVLSHYDGVVDVLTGSDVKLVPTKLKWLAKIREWCESAAIEIPSPKLNFERFFEHRLLADIKNNGQAPKHLFFVALEQHFDRCPVGVEALFIQALHIQVEEILAQRKAQDQLLSFDDLILQLKHGLDDAQLAESLVSRLRAQYQVALIDEFQDTDAVQYPIFSRVFGVGAIGYEPSLVLIGDPKQAIYGFRGGDMATYLSAKQDVTQHPKGEVYTMDKNWRSSPNMIAAMNALYLAHDNPFLEKNISYIEVSAAKESPEIDWGETLRFSALNAVADDKKLNKEQVRQYLAMICAAQLVNVLKEQALNLQAKDLAILVRDKNEAEVMRDTLLDVGLKACFDDKSNVFLSEEAKSLYALLEAVAHPGNAYLVGLVLQNPLWGVDDNDLRAFNREELEKLRWLERFNTLKAHWLRYGVLSMMREVLKCFDVLPQSRADSENMHWERTLTNFGQLAELLQEQSRVHRSETALLSWFKQAMSLALREEASEHQLRLESDEALVRIVTIHKSKGLEYPVVFLPFLYTSRESKQAWYYDADGHLCLALQPNEDELERADRERLAEESRLLYVALTRAKYQCYVGTCQFDSARSVKMFATALGYLLRRGRSVDAYNDDWLNECLEFAAKQPFIGYERYSADEAQAAFHESRARSPHSSEQSLRLSERPESPLIDTLWKVHSFTGLMNEHQSIVGEHWHPSEVLESPISKHEIHILNFPKGSQAGTFLHTLFEDVEFSSGRLAERFQLQGLSLDAHIERLLEQYELVPERLIPQWAAYLAVWLKQVLGQELMPSFSLQMLAEEDYKVEAEFYFSVETVDVAALNSVIKQFNPDAPSIVVDQFEGHIKGAIDLLFRRDGKYYVLDYKSNHLGFTAQDYRPEDLAKVILEHRYDLQYLLYSLALHRHLQARMGESYKYETHFGGVFYLFLRGLNLSTDGKQTHQTPSGVFFDCPDRALIEALDQVFSAENVLCS